tara:strand:+ start:111 stop:431 length:321 start_codon:yes stop_codon:yes gene_type:complete
MEFEVTQRILDDKILMEKNRVEELGDYYTNLYNEWKYVNGSFQIIAENLQSGERTCLHSGHSEELMRFLWRVFCSPTEWFKDLYNKIIILVESKHTKVMCKLVSIE